MNEQHSATSLNVAITLLAAGGVMSVLTGLYAGLVLLAGALTLAVAQRSTLARAIRTPDSNRRRRRLGTAGILTVVFVAAFASFDLFIGDEWTIRETLLTAIGVPAMVAAVVFLIAGLLTPRTPENRPVTPVA